MHDSTFAFNLLGTSDLVSAVRILGTGVMVVFIGLLLITVMVGLFKYVPWFKNSPTAPIRKPDEVPEEIIAAITAAVAVAIDKKFKIKRIRYRSSPENVWSKQGIATIIASHVTRRGFNKFS